MKNLATMLVGIAIFAMPLASYAQTVPPVGSPERAALIQVLQQQLTLLLQIQELQMRIAAQLQAVHAVAAAPATVAANAPEEAVATPAACDDTPHITYQAWTNPTHPTKVSEPYVLAPLQDLYFDVLVPGQCGHEWTVDANYGGPTTFKGNIPSAAATYAATLPGGYMSTTPANATITFTVYHGATSSTVLIPVSVQ